MIANTALHRIAANGITLNARVTDDRSKPPLLLLHGHPQTHLIWHKVWPALSEAFHAGRARPARLRRQRQTAVRCQREPRAHSKREMAKDMVELMQSLGFARFRVLAHDRGARVTHRMLVDHADSVERATLLDIAPTLAMYEQTNMEFARATFTGSS